MENILIIILKALKGDLKEIICGRIIFRCQLSYASLYRRLKDGFKPHELDSVRSILSKYSHQINSLGLPQEHYNQFTKIIQESNEITN